MLLIMSVFDECQAAASAIATPDIAATPQSIDHHTLLWNLRGICPTSVGQSVFRFAMKNVLQAASDSKYISFTQSDAGMAAPKMEAHAD